MPDPCGFHDATMRTFFQRIEEIRTDMKEEAATTRQDIKTLSDLVSQATYARLEQTKLERKIEALAESFEAVKEQIQHALMEKERIVAASENDRANLRRDVDSAHTKLRDFDGRIETLEDDLISRKAVYAIIGLFGTAIPVLMSFLFWLFTKLYHVDIVIPK